VSQGVEDPAHLSYLAAAQQQAQTILPKDVKDLSVRFSDLFKKGLEVGREAAKPVIPYYSDLANNKFAVLTGKDDLVDKDDPFNKAMAAFIAHADTGEVFRFKDTGIKKESLPLLSDLSHYIHKIKHVNFDYRVELGDGAKAALFKQVNNYLADLYWEKSLGLTDPLIPKDLLSKYLDKKVNVTKKMTYNHRRLLYGILVQFNEGDMKDRMANAYCHLIKEAFDSGYETNGKYFLANLIRNQKRFVPSLTMLSIKGYIPDVKVSRYKSLFLSSEIENIRESTIEAVESELQTLLKTAITADDLPKFIKNLKVLRRRVDEDVLSVEIKKVRRERLLIASQLKDSRKAKGPFKLNTAVSNKLSDPKVRAAFNPFRLAFAEGVVETAPGQAIATISYDETSGFYRYLANEYNDALDGGRVKAIALEFVAYLEG
jgi:hypothetical protein